MERTFLLALYNMSFVFGFILKMKQSGANYFHPKAVAFKSIFPIFSILMCCSEFFSQTQPKILILTSTILPWCDQHLMMILWVLFFYSLVLASKLFLHYVINTNNAEFLVFWPLTHCGQKIFYFYSRFST